MVETGKRGLHCGVTKTDIAVIDPTLYDAEILARQAQQRGLTPIFICHDSDPLSQLIKQLTAVNGAGYLHVFCHAEPGQLIIDYRVIDSQVVTELATPLRQLGSLIDRGVLLYGCEVARGVTGELFVQQLAQAMQRPVAAATDVIGLSEDGPNWRLDYGPVELASQAIVATQYQHQLAATTLTFSSDDGSWDTDHIAEDGEGGSTDIAGITIQIFNINDAGGTNTNSMNWFSNAGLASGDGFSGLTVDYNSYFNEWGGVAVRSSDGSEFKFNGFDFYDWGNQTGELMTIVAYRDGAVIAGSTVSFNANANTSRVSQDLTGNANYQNVDEVRIYFNDGAGYASINHIIIDDPVIPNTAPTLGGTPADDTATEDVATAIDLSAYNISDAELDDPITLTLSVDRGTIAALGGNGTTGGVTVAGSGTNSMTIAGGEADLNIFLDNTSNILFTSDANDTSSATLTVTPNDGTANGTADTVIINIAAVNDAPVLDAGQSPVLTAIDEDAGDDDGSGADGDDDGANNANNPGTSVAAMVVDGSITDVDGGAVEAIAVTQIDNTNGTWQYSTDNATSWNNFSGTTGSSVDLTAAARLLDGSLGGATTQLVRFVPDANYSGSANITFRAWDKSSGSAGGTANALTTGNATPFSSASDTASVTINAVNDAPVFNGLDGAPSFTEGGAAVQLDANATISDQELDALNGGNGDYSGASLTLVRNGGADASDLLSVLTGGNLTVAGGPNGGGTVTAGGNVIATVANTGNGQLQLSFADNGTTPTTALVNEVLQAIRYGSSSNDPAANVQLDFTFSDGAANGAGSVTVTLTDVNDSPILTATGSNPTFVEGGSAQDLFNTVSADTVETGQTFSALTLTVTNIADGAAEILSFDGSNVALTNGNAVNTATNGLTVNVSVTGSTATVSSSGATLSEAQLQTLIDGLVYRNTSDNPTTVGNRVVTITGVSDNGGTANGGSNSAAPNLVSTVSLTGVNDAPVVSNVYTEISQVVAGSGAQALSGFTDAAVSNADSADYNGGFIRLVQNSGTTNGNWFVDGITVTSGGDASVSAGETIQVSGTAIGTVNATNDGQGGNDFTINFGADASNAAVQTLLRNLQYEAPSALGNRGFTLTLNDADGTANGGDESASGSFTISVTPNPPVIGNLDGDSVNAAEEAGDVLLDAGSNATLTDADSANFDGGTVTVSVTNNADATSDRLLVDTSGVVSLAGVTAGSNVSVSGTVIGTLTNNIAAGNDFGVNLNANATPALTQSLLRALTFEASGQNPVESTRTVSISVSDGIGSGSADVSVIVSAVNDPPQLGGLVSDASFTEDTAANLDLSASTLSDVDTAGSVTLTLTASAGSLSASSGSGVTVGGSTTTALTLTGTISDIDTFLDGANISHTPGENLVGDDAATVSLSINDGGTNTVLGSVNIDLTAVNDPPTAADDTINVSHNGTHRFTAADFGFSDVDGGDSLQSVRIDTVPASGTLTLNATNVNNGDVITIADINASLLRYSPATGGSGAAYATLAFSVNDGTVFAAASNTLTFDVAAAPPPPPVTDPTPPIISTTVDGTTVQQQTVTENGQDVSKITIGPISGDRLDTDGSGELADIPLHFDENNQPVTTLKLPEGIGATARANSTAIDQTSFRDGLYLLRDSAPASDWFSMINGLDQWLSGIGAGWLNQISLSSNSSEPPSQPIAVSGVAGNDKTEVMVIDASQLPAGTVIELNNIEFAIIVGDVTVRGGSGSNVVFAGSGSQNIVLGPGNDELHGGADDDVIGSEGGQDRLFGDDGNDTLFGGQGSDLLHGGRGSDTVNYVGTSDEFIIVRDHAATRVYHKDNIAEGDLLLNIETIRFADRDVAIQYDEEIVWISTLYSKVLDRQADFEGLDNWAKNLDAHGSIGRIAIEFFRSSEYAELSGTDFSTLSGDEQVSLFYRELLEREPDQLGLSYWQTQMNQGATEGEVLEGIILSAEFQENLLPQQQLDFQVLDTVSLPVQVGSQHTEADLPLVALYTEIFDRQPDFTGFTVWKEQLAGEANIGDIALAFFNSMEFQGRSDVDLDDLGVMERLNFYYEELLETAPGQEAVSGWQEQINGGMTEAAILDEIINSLEFVGLYQSSDDWIFWS